MRIGRLSAKLMTGALWVVALLIAVALSWLIPPMQSPDEGSHINRAYMISKGELLLQPIPAVLSEPIQNAEIAAFMERARLQGGRAGGFIDKGLLRFTDGFMALAGQAEKRLLPTEKEQLDKLDWTGQALYYPLPGTGYYFPAIYAPQGFGLAIGQWLHFSVQQSYALAKGSTLLTCFALLGVSFRLLWPNPLVVAILLLPMSLFQMLSPTIDGLTNSLSVLAVSLFLASLDHNRRHCSVWSWSLAICIFTLATSRTHLLPLLALPFYLAWQRESRRDFYLGCFATLASLAWVLFALQTTNDPRIVRNHTTTQLLLQYAADPAAFFNIVWFTLTENGNFTFYNRSFIGILGWLDTHLADDFYPTLWTGLALCALASVSISTLQKDWGARLLLVGLCIACTGLVFLAMVVTWTPHPATVVKGVQGRYFVVPAILLAYAMSGFATQQPPLRQWIAALVIALFALASVIALTMALLGRYH